jgi:signal transduction histidine kinase
MAGSKRRLQFQASANLQRLIGRELIPTEELAVVELVKNAYDAGARKVSIRVQPETDKTPGQIEVMDDGSGMNAADFERLFMFAGYSERPEQAGKRRRVPTGEKGIGRFAADKLGRELEVITKREGDVAAATIRIDWRDFGDKRKRFSDVGARYEFGPVAGWARQKHGTYLRITGLRSRWDRPLQKRVRRVLGELLDPYNRPTNFGISLEIVGTGVVEDIVVERPGRPDIGLRFVVRKDGSVQRWLTSGGNERADIDSSSVGEQGANLLDGMSGRFLYWLAKPSPDLLRGTSTGVKLFRDGFRVEPFGSPAADWLGLAAHRATRAGHAHVVPNRLAGFVEISRTEHAELQDTTSRQTLIDTDAAKGMVHLLRAQLEFLDRHIRTKIAEPRWAASQKRQAAEQEQAKVQALSVMSVGLAHELRQPLQIIRSEASNVSRRLSLLGIEDSGVLASATAIDEGVERIEHTIELLSRLSTGDMSRMERFDLADAVNEICQFLSPRASSVGARIACKAAQSGAVLFSRTALQLIVANLIGNSLEAIRDSRVGGDVTVRLSGRGKDRRVIVEDDGPGLPPEVTAALFNTFVTKKTAGMGVGLYVCYRIAASLGAALSYHPRGGGGSSFSLLLAAGGS